MPAEHSYLFIQAIVDALMAHIAVLDPQGSIVHVNRAWVEYGRSNGYQGGKAAWKGVSYLEVCRRAAKVDPLASRFLEGLEAVLERKLPNFSFEYPCHSSSGRKWFIAFVSPVGTSDGFLVVAHNDITERKLAEEALRISHDDLESLVEERTAALRKMNEELRRALAEIEQLKDRLLKQKNTLQDEIKLEHNFENIIGKSDGLKHVLFKVEQVAPTDATVVVLGETGTGKELIARAIHSTSQRKGQPLIKVNCAALPSTLIESELFGHEKGAFTGAQNRQIGRFEVADGGTLFLDEIAELPLELQPKLLRVLQDGEFERIGSSKTLKVDVRVIAATNRNLNEEVNSGRFRQDLWYRLNVFPITVPPLRQRKEDIPLLVTGFVAKFNKKLGKQVERVPAKAMDALLNYAWPGNVRELENVIERAIILSSGPELNLEGFGSGDGTSASHQSLQSVERDHILHVLQATKWRIEGKNGAAEKLGLNPATLRSRMKKLGIRRPAP